MRLSHFKIRIVLALAIAIASLGLASTASAKLYAGDGYGPNVAPQVPTVVTTGDGFSWGDAGIGAGVAIGAVFAGLGVAYAARHRVRVVT